MDERAQEPANNRVSERGTFLQWLLIDGNRLFIAVGLVLGVFTITWVLITTETVAVGPGSSVATTFGSGIVAGLFTLVAVTLTINQLISSRVFGAPDEFRQKFRGGRQVRQSVEEIADRQTSPVSLSGFISFIGETLEENVDSLADELDCDAVDGDVDVDDYLSGIREYATRIQRVSGDERPAVVIDLLAGSEYARCIRETEQLARDNYDRVPQQTRDDLDAIVDLLKELSVSRQYYKTVALQQELGRLSQLLVFIGLPSLLVAVYVSLIYRSGGLTTIPPQYLPLTLSGAVAIVVFPFAVLISHLLRVSTIMRYTVSVAPFTPPVEWPWRR